MVNQPLMMDVASLFIDQVTVDWFGKTFLMLEKKFCFWGYFNFKFQIEIDSTEKHSTFQRIGGWYRKSIPNYWLCFNGTLPCGEQTWLQNPTCSKQQICTSSFMVHFPDYIHPRSLTVHP